MCTTALVIGLSRKWIYIMWCVCTRLSVCFTAILCCVSCAIIIFEIVAVHEQILKISNLDAHCWDLIRCFRTLFLVKFRMDRRQRAKLRTSNFELWSSKKQNGLSLTNGLTTCSRYNDMNTKIPICSIINHTMLFRMG